MKSHWLTIGLMFVLTCPAIAQDQMQLGNMAAKESNQTDKELNVVYQQVLKKYASKKVFIPKLRLAELAWIKYRDAYVASVFPEAKSNPDQYGSAFDMCFSSMLTQETVQRTNDLKKLVNPGVPKIADAPNKFVKASRQVDKLYLTALKLPHDQEPSFAKKFKIAQDAWGAFAIADTDAWSTLANDVDKDAVKMSRLYQLYAQRAKLLDEWVKGIPEGDVCVGSRVVQQ